MSAPALSSAYLSKRETDELVAFRDRVNGILDFRARQFSLFDPPPVVEPAAAIAPAVVALSSPESVPAVLSPTTVATFLSCSAKWYYRKILRLPELRSAAAVLGSAVHEAVQVNYIDKLETGRDLDYAAVKSVFRESMRRQFDEGGIALSADESQADLEACGDVLVRVYMDEVAPRIMPAAVEKRVEGVIGGVKVHGIVDVIDANGVVIDLKTASKKPCGISSDHRLQVSTYVMLAPQACGIGRRDVITKTKTVQHHSQTFTVGEADRKYCERLYSISLDQMRSGLIAPNRDGFTCSKRYCSFWRECTSDFGGEVSE